MICSICDKSRSALSHRGVVGASLGGLARFAPLFASALIQGFFGKNERQGPISARESIVGPRVRLLWRSHSHHTGRFAILRIRRTFSLRSIQGFFGKNEMRRRSKPMRSIGGG
jgi:hypothetical protein